MKFLLSSIFVLATGLSFAGNGYLGVNIAKVELLDQDQQKASSGVLVTGVIEGSAADKAGLQRDDIIESVNGEAVHHPSELISYLNNLNPGETVHLKLVRGDLPMEMDVELGERTFERRLRDPKKWVFMSHHPQAWLGVEYFELTPELAEFFNVQGGLFIKSVVEDSPAKNAGLLAGDIILSMGGLPLDSKRDFSKKMADHAEGDNVAFEINRKGQVLDFSVTLGKRQLPSVPNFEFKFSPDGEVFNFDGDHFKGLENLPEHLDKLKPMVEMFEFKDMEALQNQLEELREELNKLKEDKKDN